MGVLSQNFLQMVELIVLLPVSLGAIILTQDIARSPLSYLIFLHPEDTMVINLPVCKTLITVIDHTLVTRSSPAATLD